MKMPTLITIERQVKQMLNSKRILRIKVGYVEQFSKFFLRQQLFAFNEFCMGTRLSNILKTTSVTNFTKAIIEFYKLHLNRKR